MAYKLLCLLSVLGDELKPQLHKIERESRWVANRNRGNAT